MARAKYARQLKDYCALYHVSVSGLNKLVARGKRAEPPELPPFDQPELMAAWYARHHSHTPPPRLLELAEGPPTAEQKPPAQQKKPAAGQPPSPDPVPPPLRTAVDVEAVGSMNLVAAAANQEKKVSAEWQNYQTVMADRNATQQALKAAAERYDASITTLAAIQAKVTEDEIKRGDRPLLNDIRSELLPLVENIASAFVSVLTERAGLPRDRARELADECFRELSASRFGTLIPAGAAA
jgi:hypothetical protein